MSIFDPHGLYFKHERKIHKGQIIQKRPTNLHGAITGDEVPRSERVLQGFGYYVFPPTAPPAYYQFLVVPFAVHCTQSISLPVSSSVSVPFSFLYNYASLSSTSLKDAIYSTLFPFQDKFKGEIGFEFEFILKRKQSRINGIFQRSRR